MNTTTSLTAAHTASGAVRTPWTEFVRKFRKQHLAMIAGYFVLFLIVVALLAPWIVPFDAENFFDYDALNAPPSFKHWFGVDSPGRETDIAIDHSEFSRLDEAQIAQAVAVMQAEGLHATVSSIHINGWIGTHDKWQGACWIARELLDRDLSAEAERWVYVGDSTNDQVMFEHLPQSVGVANVRRFESKLKYLPRYITRGERGAGFAEVARALLADRT